MRRRRKRGKRDDKTEKKIACIGGLCLIILIVAAVFFYRWLWDAAHPVERVLRQAPLAAAFRYEGRENAFEEGLWALAHEDAAFLEIMTDGSLDAWMERELEDGRTPRDLHIAWAGREQNARIQDFLEEYRAYVETLDPEIELKTVLPYAAAWERDADGTYVYPVHADDTAQWPGLWPTEQRYVSRVPYYVADDATEDEMVALFFSCPAFGNWMLSSASMQMLLDEIQEEFPVFRPVLEGDAIPDFCARNGVTKENCGTYPFPGVPESGSYAQTVHDNLYLYLHYLEQEE